jgi:D-glycero-D-manno-heptose 1,7-bisphosphate phosphatase
MAMRPAVFIDKDGTLVKDVPYNVDPARVELREGAIAGLACLHRAGFALVIVSNQSGVARGYFDEASLAPVWQAIAAPLAQRGVPIAGIYYCPHHPAGRVPRYTRACDCRKPQPGMLMRAARELDLDVTRSWMLGDILDDVEAGHRAGCRSVLLDVGSETEWRAGAHRVPDHIEKHFGRACEHIVAAHLLATEPA